MEQKIEKSMRIGSDLGNVISVLNMKSNFMSRNEVAKDSNYLRGNNRGQGKAAKGHQKYGLEVVLARDLGEGTEANHRENGFCRSNVLRAPTSARSVHKSCNRNLLKAKEEKIILLVERSIIVHCRFPVLLARPDGVWLHYVPTRPNADQLATMFATLCDSTSTSFIMKYSG
ncbi:hypothetical protein J6590_034752 [Homalodisca vitripennis]|nr:hypothetical protein J6590_034752 [Homalodisca vitripennis]